MSKILSFGEIIWDVYPQKRVIGGAPLNFAAHASLCGAESALISAVGDDELGRAAIGALREYGVRDGYVGVAGAPTGQCLVTLDERSVPTYRVLSDVAYDLVTLSDAQMGAIRSERFDAFYFGSLSQRALVSRGTLRKLLEVCSFGVVFCDVNLRPGCYSAETVRYCLSNATVIKISAEEEPLLREMGMYGSVADPLSISQAICARYPKIGTVILTLGKDGSFLYERESGKGFRQPAIGDTVVSTVGAGDSFSAAYLVARLAGKSVEECLRRAAEVSGFVVAHTEAVPRY